MAQHIVAGIDVGTYQVKVVVAEASSKKRRGAPRILGTGFAESKGLRHGYIINSGDVVRSIRAAIVQAEKASKQKIRKAYLSIGGIGLEETLSHGEAIITRADGEITDLDISRAFDNAEEKIAQYIINRKILHTIPIKFKIDGHSVLGRPQGMKGTKLEVETLFISCLEQHLEDLIQAVEDIGVQIDDVIASPLAGSFVTLTKAQKTAGCVLANIGAETVSIVVFENNVPCSLKVFPIGSTDITNDIALGLKISLEEAEKIKHGAITNTSISKKKLDEIILARLSDIFELIEAHLKKLGKSGLLPAGIIITGGGSGITTIEDLARATLKLPSKTSGFDLGENTKVRDSSWAVTYGLCIWGLTEDIEPIGMRFAKKTGNTLMSWVKQFLP